MTQKRHRLKSKTRTSLDSLRQDFERVQRRAARLERDLALIALPQQFGFNSPEAFVWAFREATGLIRRHGDGRGRKRALITPEMLEQLRERTAAGEGADDIAKALGIAVQTVRNKWSVLEMKRPNRPRIPS